MLEKEIAEIRRRYKVDKTNISRIRGCYVSENKEILSEFDQSFGLMSESESEEILSIIRKTFSGTVGKNLIDIDFSNEQVTSGAEHQLLMKLRESALGDHDAAYELYEKIVQTLQMDTSYIIILSHEDYDVIGYSKFGDAEESTEVFSYILCSICPIKITKPALSYYALENKFQNIAASSVISSPAVGFMFPAFDDRTTNIYNALYYTRDITDSRDEFIDTLFKSEIPMPAAAQKARFQDILSESVSEDCTYEVAASLHNQLREIVSIHKESKDDEPLVVSKETVKTLLKECDVSDSHIESFDENFNNQFGENSEINPLNLVDVKQFEVNTSDVKIKVNPERSDLLEVKVIDGVKYIMIRANEGVEVNGVSISVSEE